MPKVIKKRPVKKKPADEIEVKSAALQALEKIKERQRHLIIGASVIAALVVLFMGISLYSTSQYKKASSLEQEASGYYFAENIDTTLPEKERLNKALELFQGSTNVKVTPINLFYLGNTYFRLGDYENAINEYKRFIAKYRSEKAIVPLVYQKLASSYFKTGSNEAALETLAKLASFDGGIFKDTALVQEARYLEGAGKQEASLEKYREIVARYPSSPWAAEANTKVSAVEARKEADANVSAAGEEKQADTGAKQAGQSDSMQDTPKDPAAAAK